MAVNYRLLNQILELFSYPILDIREILQDISGKKYYVVLNLHSAFFQINLRPENSQKLSFIIEHVKFWPLRFSLETHNSSVHFPELIDKILWHFDRKNVAYFIDAVLIKADSIPELLDILEKVLQTLIENNLTIEPCKR